MPPIKNKKWASALTLAGVLLFASNTHARPPGPVNFCETYPEAPACAGGSTNCAMCHAQTPALNAFGAQLSEALAPGEERPLSDAIFSAQLPDALAAIEDLDADGDGASNLDEITIGTSPSDAQDAPTDGPQACADGVIPIEYDVCAYDHAYVFKKLHLDFCGYSPMLDEVRAFQATEDKDAALTEALDRCLDTEYWRGRDGVVWNLANDKINPIQAIKSGENAGPIPLADYLDDYNFFVYTHTDGRDVREALTGEYFVERVDPREGVEATQYTPFYVDRRALQDYTTGQIVQRNRRAGLITHRWFLMSTIMFTSIPRTAAAQAYRAYLGKNIARLEGLAPIDGEPADYDDKGVKEEECAICHSTLDPLTYPFAAYEGIGGGEGDYGNDIKPFQYNPGRLDRFIYVDGPNVVNAPEAGYILGERVEDLVGWAEVAANSDEYAQATVKDYWVLLMGEAPRASEQAEFDKLWRDLKGENAYSVEAMLHDLIKTEAYGVP